MAKFAEKLEARKLRQSGESIKGIAKKLSVSPSSISLWCRDIILTEEQANNLSAYVFKCGMKGRLMGAEGNRRKKREAIELARKRARERLSEITSVHHFIAGLALYWAEGSKSSSTEFSFVNSDHRMILFITKWLKNHFKIKNEDFILRVAINEMHRPREEKVLQYWTKLLGIPLSQFRATSFIKTQQKKVYANYDTYFGTLIIRVRRSTNMRYEILSSIEILANAGVAQW